MMEGEVPRCIWQRVIDCCSSLGAKGVRRGDLLACAVEGQASSDYIAFTFAELQRSEIMAGMDFALWWKF